MIIDYSVARPAMSALKAAGVTAVGRYLGWDGQPGFSNIHKNLTRTEAAHLTANGIAIFVSFEYAADAVTHGRQQGLKDGKLASEQLHDLGAPPGMAVYFAVDFDIRDYAPHSSDPAAKLGPAADYFAAINSLSPRYQVGVYGGYYAVSRCLDAKLATIAWQTVAWSGGQWDERAVLRQKLGAPLAGADLDTVRENTSHGHDYGQWPRPALPKRKPPEYVTHVTAGHLSFHDLCARHGATEAHVLRLTAKFAPFTPETYAWLNGVLGGSIDPVSLMPPGLTWRVPVNP
jgi:hypothetical protein